MLDNQKMLNTEKTVSISASAIIIVSIYVAAQMLADIGSLKVALDRKSTRLNSSHL